MRIASKIKVLAIMLGSFVLSEGLAQPVLGQTTSLPPPPALPAAPPEATTTGAGPSLAAPPSVQMAAGTLPNAAPLPAFPSVSAGDSKPAPFGGGNLGNLENKTVPDSVKEVVKHLDKSTTEDVTLDDLNSARQAVAKIEALIDIEKHLAELDKVRQEREKKTSFASAIPASALQPPTSMMLPAQVSGHPAAPVSEKPSEVLRIMGRNGHYSAVVKMPDDKTKKVEIGDQLSDGSKVIAITSTEVDVEHGGTRKALHIKNVETVFGGSF